MAAPPGRALCGAVSPHAWRAGKSRDPEHGQSSCGRFGPGTPHEPLSPRGDILLQQNDEVSSYSRTTRYPHTVERSSTAFGCLRHTLSASRLLLRRSGEWLRADICTPKRKMVSNNVDAGLRVTRRPGLLLAYFSQRGGAPY